MAYLSIRKLPPELALMIQKEVQKRQMTKTDVVIEALKLAFHLEKSPPKAQRNIRGFFGKMSQKDYEEFQKLTQHFSTIDEELWKA